MKKFIKDIFSEEEGKYSSKRFMGILTGVLAGLGSVFAGLHWYDIPAEVLNPMWIYSGAMLGVSILKGMMK